MPLPQVAEQVRLAPVRALRAIFAGIGQLLLAADRLRTEDSGSRRELTDADEAHDPLTVRAPGEGGRAPVAGDVGDAAGRSPWRSLDSTGNVRVLTREDMTARRPETPQPPATPPAPATPPRAAGKPDLPPIPGYDDLSLASLRARLRTLDADQLRQFLGYERAHANRADVVTMFERRLAKLAAGGSGPAGGPAAGGA